MTKLAIYTGKRNELNEKLYLCVKGDYITADSKDFNDFANGWELVDFLESNSARMRKEQWERGWHYTVNHLAKKEVIDNDAFAMILNYLKQANLTREDIEKERVKRLKALHLESNILNMAITDKMMVVSERMGYPWGVNYYLNGYTYEDEVRTAMEKIRRMDGVPYFATVDHLRDGGILVSVLYVSMEWEYWKDENMDADGYIFAGVYNSGMDCMDYGTIQIQPGMGGVLRIQ